MGSCLSMDGSSSLPYTPRIGRPPKRKSKSDSLGSKRKEQLRKVPGKILNGSSGLASLFTQQGKKGINQDAMVVWENFGSRSDTIFCGVFDGHGPFGHMVARRVRDSLPLKLIAHWRVNMHSTDDSKDSKWDLRTTAGSVNSDGGSSIAMDDKEADKDPEIFLKLKDSFLKAFRAMDKELRGHANIDCFFSGTTAVTLIKQGLDLVIGNIGDSRAVLGTRDEDNTLTAVQLTVDLKPNLPREAERIKKCRGRVFALSNEPEVARVWLPNNDCPGLAMARAFGDFCLKDFGLISVPDISRRRLTEKDEFIILATDGIWNVLSNKEAVDIVASAPIRSNAAKTLVESAVREWRFKYPSSKADDCAVICLFLDPSPSISSNGEFKEHTSSMALETRRCEPDLDSPILLQELPGTAQDCPVVF